MKAFAAHGRVRHHDSRCVGAVCCEDGQLKVRPQDRDPGGCPGRIPLGVIGGENRYEWHVGEIAAVYSPGCRAQ
ncbi:hypothetical protein Sdia_40300 [Streptomyces diastaticus subsp. diastaticus]|uniref:Transposase n=1 Tax=Streptomyces diastaticus subsp. diastaticus TaxID=68040 RepID=A0ABQ1CSK1_STRDI|nr:hypothetical protein Sdia_40300 [Streptomyces diastaticus subsp. diastaticus]GGU50058.1 hypothetical protein GCM10015534_59460 [Streptomyces diastaticus subsp. diastaticus]